MNYEYILQYFLPETSVNIFVNTPNPSLFRHDLYVKLIQNSTEKLSYVDTRFRVECCIYFETEFDLTVDIDI